MLIGSILNPGRGKPPPPAQPQQPEPQSPSLAQNPPLAEPPVSEPPQSAEPQPAASPPPPTETAAPPPSASQPSSSQPSTGPLPSIAAPVTSVAAALSANPPARSDYQAMGSWIAQGTVPVATAPIAASAIPAKAADAADGATREVILRDAWTSVLAQANVARADVIELLR